MGSNDAAIRDLSAAVNGAGDITPETLRQSYYHLAQVYRRVQRPEDSKAALQSFARLKQEADSQQNQKFQDKLARSNETQTP